MNEFANAAAAAIDLTDEAIRIAPTASMKRIDLADLPRWNVHAQRLLEGARDVLRLFHAWAEPSDHRLTPHELHAAYLAHMPLKRMAFLEGYLNRPFEAMWDRLQPG